MFCKNSLDRAKKREAQSIVKEKSKMNCKDTRPQERDVRARLCYGMWRPYRRRMTSCADYNEWCTLSEIFETSCDEWDIRGLLERNRNLKLLNFPPKINFKTCWEDFSTLCAHNYKRILRDFQTGSFDLHHTPSDIRSDSRFLQLSLFFKTTYWPKHWTKS